MYRRGDCAQNSVGSDLGEVSWNTPSLAFLYPTFPIGVGLHTWPVTACGGTSIGTKAAIGSAELMALFGNDLLNDPELVAAARRGFEERRKGKEYISPLICSKAERPVHDSGDEILVSN